MIIFKELQMQNFLSYGNDLTTIPLNHEGAMLITGINYDASVGGEYDSNGCGKSSILNAISYALYNKTISISEKLGDLINNINKKDMYVSLTFSVHSKDYKVSRYRKNSAMGGNGVKVEELRNGEWIDITTTKPEPQIADDILGIPYTIFNRIIGYAAGEEPFLKQGLAKQREVIDELFGFSDLIARAENIKEDIRDLKKDLEVSESLNEEIKKEKERHVAQVEEMEEKSSKWISDTNEKMKELEGEISDISKFDFEKEEKLLNELSEKKDVLSDLFRTLDDKNRELEDYEYSTSKFKSFRVEQEALIKRLEKDLDALDISEIDFDKQIEILETIEVISEEVSELESKHSENKRELDILNKSLDEHLKEMEHLKDNKCPYCLQQFADAKEKAEEVLKNKTELSEAIKILSEKIDDLISEKTSKELEIENVESFAQFKSISEINSLQNKMERLVTSLEVEKEKKNPYEDKESDIVRVEGEKSEVNTEIKSVEREISEINESLLIDDMSSLTSLKTTLKHYEESLEKLKNEENPYEELLNNLLSYEPKEDKSKEIEELRNLIKHSEFLVKLLTKRDSYIRQALMSKYLPLLNERLHHYLVRMSLPHKVLFNSDLTVSIQQFDQEIPYGNLSAGQRARINIALSLAFRDVLQTKHNYINLYILDECLDVGLSNVGVRKTVKAIKEVAESNNLSMFVISHRDEAKESFDKKLNVELRNGFSTISFN